MRFILLALSLTLGFPALADVYRWVDDEGNVHYGDQPKGEAKLMSRSRTVFEEDDPDTAAEDEPAASPTPRKETPFAAGKESASDEERCKEFRARVQRYQGAGDMFIDNPDGSRHKLAAEEREQLISRTRQQAEEACSEAGL